MSRSPSVVQRERFLEHFARSLNVAESARAAGFGRSTAYRLRERDREFAAAWAEAEEVAVDAIVAAAYRYATEGAEERVYDADGNLVSRRVREDPTSAARLLAAHRPDVYSEKRRLEVLGRVEHEVVAPPVVVTLAEVLERSRELEAGSAAIEVVAEEESEL